MSVYVLLDTLLYLQCGMSGNLKQYYYIRRAGAQTQMVYVTTNTIKYPVTGRRIGKVMKKTYFE